MGNVVTWATKKNQKKKLFSKKSLNSQKVSEVFIYQGLIHETKHLIVPGSSKNL